MNTMVSVGILLIKHGVFTSCKYCSLQHYSSVLNIFMYDAYILKNISKQFISGVHTKLHSEYFVLFTTVGCISYLILVSGEEKYFYFYLNIK